MQSKGKGEKKILFVKKGKEEGKKKDEQSTASTQNKNEKEGKKQLFKSQINPSNKSKLEKDNNKPTSDSMKSSYSKQNSVNNKKQPSYQPKEPPRDIGKPISSTSQTNPNQPKSHSSFKGNADSNTNESQNRPNNLSNKPQGTKKPEKSFYDYSLSLHSFSFLNKTPMTVHQYDQCSLLSNPVIIYGVIGNRKCGKTQLISELQAKYSVKDENYTFNDTKQSEIYLKSVLNNETNNTNVLFMKVPSFGCPLENNNSINYKALINDRRLMRLFSIGFAAYFCNILLIVIDFNWDKDYRQCYHEIVRLRRQDDKIFIVHNLDRLLPLEEEMANNQRIAKPMEKEDNKAAEGSKRKAERKNTFDNSNKTKDTKKEPFSTKGSFQKKISIEKVIPPPCKEEEKIPAAINQEEKKKKIEELLKILDNESEYEKNNFITMELDSKLKERASVPLEYYYKEKKNPNIIHLLYQPLSKDDTTTTQKQYNTQMINFLVSTGACYIQTQQKEKKEFLKAFTDYTTSFLKHIYKEQDPQLAVQGNEIKLSQQCTKKPITKDLINLDGFNPQEFKPKYSYQVNKENVVIVIETSIKAAMKATGKIIHDMNVLSFEIDYKRDVADRKQIPLECTTLPIEKRTFQIKIPTNHCVINNFKPTFEWNNDGTIRFTFTILQENDEEDQGESVTFI